MSRIFCCVKINILGLLCITQFNSIMISQVTIHILSDCTLLTAVTEKSASLGGWQHILFPQRGVFMSSNFLRDSHLFQPYCQRVWQKSRPVEILGAHISSAILLEGGMDIFWNIS